MRGSTVHTKVNSTVINLYFLRSRKNASFKKWQNNFLSQIALKLPDDNIYQICVRIKNEM